MIRRTYGQVKDYLAALAGNTGMAVSNPLVMAYANNAVRELMNLGDWPGVVDRWYFRFDEMTGLVTLPYELERFLAVTVDDTPKEIRSPWFEFVQYGPGQMHDEETDTQGNTRPRKIDWFNVAADRGDAATQFPLPVDGGPWNLRVKGFVDETVEGVNPTINLQGLDFTGHPVRTLSDGTGSGDWVNGEDIAIEDGVVHTSASTFSTVAAVAKPVTASHVLLTAWNGVTEVTLADYEWNDTAPTYRRYFIPSLYRDKTGVRDRIILARCRRRFMPVAEDNDTLLIGNEIALGEMMQAQYQRSIGNFGGTYTSSDQVTPHLQSAVKIMREESLAYMGKSRVPSISFQRGWSLGQMNPVR